MRSKTIVALLVLLSLLLLACGPSLSPAPTATPLPPPATRTPVPAEEEQQADPTRTPKPEVVEEPTETPEAVVEEPTDEPTAEPESQQEGGIVKKPEGGQDGGAQTTDSVFTFNSHTAWVGDSGDISIVGEVINTSDQTIDTLVSIQAVLTDENGELVQGDFGAYLDRPVIPPGEMSSFWVLITSDQLGGVDPNGITDYELTLYVSEDPSPDVELSVTEAQGSEESDGYFINGTVENQTGETFGSLSVYSTLYDADGNVMNATVDMISLDVPLAPGEQAEFQGWFPDHYAGADSWYVFVTGWAETFDSPGQQEESGGGLTSADGILEVQSHTGWTNDDGSISIVGEVLNVSSDTTVDTVVMIEALLYDADGNSIEGDFSAYLDRPVVPPGEISSFWVYITSDQLGGFSGDEVTDYELLFWITEDPSPDVELMITDASGSAESDGFYIVGSAENQTDLTFDTLAVYSLLYDADGNVINATVDMISLDTPLAPGDQAEFQGWFPDHYDGADSWYVVVTGYPQ